LEKADGPFWAPTRLSPSKIHCRKAVSKIPFPGSRIPAHHSHIEETGNEPYRYRHSCVTVESRIKALERSKRGKAGGKDEPF
jgi:hypothetical protein